MNPAVVTVGMGGWHPQGVDRLARSLKRVGFDGDLLSWTDRYPPDSPTHQDIPYAFKCYAIRHARDAGYNPVIWCDAAVWAIRPLDPIIAYIRHVGHLLLPGGWNTGQWCSDAALPLLDLTREEAFTLPHLMACCMGFDFTHTRTEEFFLQWISLQDAFPGPWTNANGEASPDPRVLGHRHDQTVASVISHRLGMEWVQHDLPLRYHSNNMRVPPYVSLLSRGGCGTDWEWADGD